MTHGIGVGGKPSVVVESYQQRLRYHTWKRFDAIPFSNMYRSPAPIYEAMDKYNFSSSAAILRHLHLSKGRPYFNVALAVGTAIVSRPPLHPDNSAAHIPQACRI